MNARDDFTPVRVGGIAGLVLAGGEGRRMGAGLPKPLRLLQGRPMIAHVIERIRPQVMQLAISSSDAESYRGFGLPILEALAKGLPIIASDLPVLRDLGAHLVVYVDVRDTRSLTDAMATFAQASADEGERAKRIAHAMPYTWRACAERTVGVYRELW